MRITPLLVAGLLATRLLATSAEPIPPRPRPDIPLQPAPSQPSGSPSKDGELTKFDLDFPGGTARDLVAAIQTAWGKPLNAIVPDEHAETKLPALKMKQVTIPQLFAALQAATSKTIVYTTGTYYGGGNFGGYKSTQQYRASCGFKTVADKVTDDSIWYFYVDSPALPEGSSTTRTKICRFYPLAPYINRHLSVDDITTAIETGWKMLGEGTPAVMKFHKDTKLLIAVGEPTALETIDAELLAKISEIDLRDGVKDQKMTPRLTKCPGCGQTLSTKSSRCLYCGATVPKPHVFQ
jgi:hypothetical protein